MASGRYQLYVASVHFVRQLLCVCRLRFERRGRQLSYMGQGYTETTRRRKKPAREADSAKQWISEAVSRSFFLPSGLAAPTRQLGTTWSFRLNNPFFTQLICRELRYRNASAFRPLSNYPGDLCCRISLQRWIDRCTIRHSIFR